MVARKVPGVGSLLFLIAVAAAAPAQGRSVTPPARATTEGNSSYALAFGAARLRFQQLIAPNGHTVPPGASLIAAAVRRDGPSPVTFLAKTVRYEVWVSESPVAATSISPVFAENRGPAAVRVFDAKDVSFPPAPPGPIPSAIMALWPFDRPFRYQATGRSLCIEWVALAPAQRFSEWIVDREWATPAGGQGSRAVGTSCGGAGRLEVEEGTLFAGAAVWYWSGDVAPALHGSPLLAVMGASVTSWGGIPLPFDLAPLGAPGCAVRSDLLAVQTGVVRSATWLGDHYDVFWRTPASAALFGARFSGQVWILAPANALGVVTTNAEDCVLSRVPPSLEIGYCYSEDLAAPEGAPFLNRGVVLSLEYR
jgi:hypothetical protein